MRLTPLFGITAIALSAALWLPTRLVAQDDAHERAHHRYKLVDLGTFGGPISYGSVNGDGARLLNNRGKFHPMPTSHFRIPTRPTFALTPIACSLTPFDGDMAG